MIDESYRRDSHSPHASHRNLSLYKGHKAPWPEQLSSQHGLTGKAFAARLPRGTTPWSCFLCFSLPAPSCSRSQLLPGTSPASALRKSAVHINSHSSVSDLLHHQLPASSSSTFRGRTRIYHHKLYTVHGTLSR